MYILINSNESNSRVDILVPSMIFVHLLFWFFIGFCTYILIKCREHVDAVLLLIGALFIAKLRLLDILLNISTYHVFVSYVSWLVTSNSLVTIVGLVMTISMLTRLITMFKQWIKIGVLLTILYWFRS